MQFATLNQHYGYFENNHNEAYKLFISLSKACHAMIVLFEKNNHSEDTMAYEYAYKLMALYANPSMLEEPTLFDYIAEETYELLNGIESSTPFHDALLVKLLLPHANDLNDKAGWAALIKTEGYAALPFLSMGKKLEQQFAFSSADHKPRAPINLDEAKMRVKLHIGYERETQKNSHLAKICHQYKIPEMRFNACLDYLLQIGHWPLKEDDNIPKLIIKNEQTTHRLYWVKLPVQDMRGLILGDMTNCCQSIGGSGEQCVKDAFSLENNGIYVLLKQKSKTAHHPNPFTPSNETNDEEFDVIGHSYIWKSMTGNICLDSLEIKDECMDTHILQTIMVDFATELLRVHPDIKYVTLGTGGKTPYFSFSMAEIPEKMLQGYDYGDAHRQFLIAKTPHFVLSESLQTSLQTLLENYPLSFKQCVRYLIPYMKDPKYFVKALPELLSEDYSFVTKLTSISLFQTLLHIPNPSVDDLFSQFPKEVERLSIFSSETNTSCFFKPTFATQTQKEIQLAHKGSLY